MTDDQGDAQRGASSTAAGQGASTGAPTPPVAQTLVDLQATVEELARRMGAGFREDLAQIRAIATSVAERDVTDDVRALRAEVAALASAGSAQPVRDELAAVRGELARLASADALSAVQADLAPLHATLDRIAARLDDDSGRTQVLARFQAVESKLDALAGSGDGTSDLVARLDRLEQRLDGLPSADQIGRLPADLQAHVIDALGGLDGEKLQSDRAALLTEIQDNLADVASGEVVGALWDEVRGVRGEVEGIGAALAASVEPHADPAVAGMREDVQALSDEVRALSDAVAAIERDVILPSPPPIAPETDAESDPVLVQLTEELATLRADLSEGLVVEPSDALSASLDALRTEVDGLHEALGDFRAQAAAPVPTPEPAAATEPGLSADDLAPLLDELASIRSGVDEVRTQAATPAPAPEPAGPSADTLATLFDELSSIRTGVDEVRGRLEEGLVLEHDEPAALTGTPPAEIEVLVDQVAALRDLVSSEVDGLRQAVTAAADRTEEAARAREESAPAAPTPVPVADAPAALDPAVVEDLKDEIRAAGAVGDQVVDALREELRALRRRIAVKAAEKVLDEDQLRQIADAVAERLQQQKP